VTPLRTLIIGCGNIAGGFDAARGRADEPLTHAGAYSRDGRFRLAGCVEPDKGRRDAFMRQWRVERGFPTLDDACRAGERYDVVSICSPTPSHAADLRAALALRPKLIFCEKPVTSSARDTERALRDCQAADVALAVNYTRRWDPSIDELRAGLRDGRWGALRSAVGFYNKGLLNNGSHLIDLLLLLLGPLGVKAVGRAIQDYAPEDPSIPASLETSEGASVHLACGHAADFALFELQFVFAGAVLTMEEGGLAWRERRPVESSLFSGYRVLDEGLRRAGSYGKAMLRAADNLFAALVDGAPLASSGESALAAQRLCEEIRRQ
jgi:predicted dehydrogenase